ncbi:hypothetical protein [Paenibacillus sp. NPDC055715]
MGELTTAKRITMIALLVVLWGISWPIYKVALQFTPPLLFAGFLVPVISVFVSSLLLHEAITAFLLIGLILIGLSIYLVNRRARIVQQA